MPRGFGAAGLAALGLLQLGWGVRQAVTLRRLRAASSRSAEDASGKAQFLRLASHEIRGPLALARGYVDIVRSETLGPVAPEVGEALATVDQKLRQIEDLVVRMVEASRVDSNAGLSLTRLDLREVVEEAAAGIAEQLGPAHELVVDRGERAVPVMGERFRLRTMLSNLLSNAVKYSPDGGEVRCTLSRRGRGVVVTVADRGIGMAAGEMRSLFQPFVRLSEGTRVAPNGLGLGLHLSRSIAEAHGGRLTAAPNPGGGSVFTVWLPRAG